jgi:hypothetical protein
LNTNALVPPSYSMMYHREEATVNRHEIRIFRESARKETFCYWPGRQRA